MALISQNLGMAYANGGNLEARAAMLLGSLLGGKALATAGVKVVLPGDEDSDFVDHMIYTELAVGETKPEVRDRFLDICSRHIASHGIDGVILACTELPLVISNDDLPVEVLDTTGIHVDAILAAAG